MSTVIFKSQKFYHYLLVLRKKDHPAWTRRKAFSEKIRNRRVLYNPTKIFYKYYCNFTSGARATPSFYLIGMSSSGSSSFFMNLIKHPQIYPPVKKETRFFNHQPQKGLNWYKANFPLRFRMSSNQITGEGTPSYMNYYSVPQRIKDYTPNAKFIVLLRNPIDRAFSIYNKYIRKGFEKLSFEDTINLELELIKNKDIEKDDANYSLFVDLNREKNTHMLLRLNMYAALFKRWFQVFPNPTQFLILENEELKKYPQETYSKTFEFLGLKEFKIENYSRFNVQNKKSIMLESTRKLLQEFFKPYNESLYKLLGTRFDWD